MAVTQTNNGSQTTTVSTEHTLATVTAAGVYVLRVDLSPMLNGDRVVLRVKTKTLAGSTSRLEFSGVYEHVQADPNVVSIPVPVAHEVVFTLQQTAGTSRTFDWSVLSL